jgi:hypothetical protein
MLGNKQDAILQLITDKSSAWVAVRIGLELKKLKNLHY